MWQRWLLRSRVKLPIDNDGLEWDKIEGKPFLVRSSLTLLMIVADDILRIADRDLGKERESSLKLVAG